jgi:hypothetical protein
MERRRWKKAASATMRPFPCAQRWGGDSIYGNWKGKNAATNGDNEDVRKLNPYLIDRSDTPLHVWRPDPTSAGEAQ